MPDTTTSSSVLITAGVMEQAATLMVGCNRPLWTGLSGERSTGETVARHLEAAVDLLDETGWIRTWTVDAGQLGPVEDGASTQAMLRQLLDYVREEDAPGRPVTAVTALSRIAGTEHGDPDTRDIAQEVLNLLVQALTGHPTARFAAWAERRHRTHAEITLMLTAGALFARKYGPRPPVAS
ncbi:hypothetical protein [Streptomyces sp. st115]|uniref:DUF6197 family protein n=1 Tax=Streptomyces sp. st115 TaxID=1828047 RepID=UPI000BF151C2|nr:hypothetical protein [Streptomyces sp. st115]